MDIIKEAKRVFNIEISALEKTRDFLNNTFVEILDMIVNCKGKLIITGIGKPGHIAKKLAATFASLGTPSFYLHPAEAQHGDLGMITSRDVVMVISYSGESDEIIHILQNIRLIGAKIICITGNENSTLAKASDLVQVLPKFEEACYLGLTPTSSTTAELCYGDALAVVASGVYGFKDVDFGKFHPAGSLGKKVILTVNDLMAKDDDNPIININATLKEAIVQLSKHGIGMVSVVDDEGKIKGIVTDGDLRRLLEKGVDVYSMQVRDVMTSNPTVVESENLAVNALALMKNRNISCAPVADKGIVVGAIKTQTILLAGII